MTENTDNPAPGAPSPRDYGARSGISAASIAQWCAQIAILLLVLGGPFGLARAPAGVDGHQAEATAQPVDIDPTDEAASEAAGQLPLTALWTAQPSRPQGQPWAKAALHWSPAAPQLAVLSQDIKKRHIYLRKGDTLMALLKREGVAAADAHYAIAALSKNYNLRKLQPGQQVTLGFSPDEPRHLQKVALKAGFDRVVRADRDGVQGFTGAIEQIPLKRLTARAGGQINDSLYVAARQSSIPHAVIIDLIQIYSFDVDFQREIRTGDEFEVYFERYVDDQGQVVKEGPILYANLVLSGDRIQLYRFTPGDTDRADYFDEEGHSVRKTLLRTPVDGARLTSYFGKRRHPILGYSRMHKGVDFGARSGTPVRAAGDGVVEKASRNGGYGRYIRIRHNSTYKTAYAHLNGYARGIKAGAKVKQSQIIGYVGSSGRSTGPHLHYEVQKRGAHVNPLRLRLPSGRRLNGEQLAVFKDSAARLMAEIEATPITTLLASTQ